jgi:hypothetical protein
MNNLRRRPLGLALTEVFVSVTLARVRRQARSIQHRARRRSKPRWSPQNWRPRAIIDDYMRMEALRVIKIKANP